MNGKTAKLFVGNLPHDAKIPELREKFSKYGEVLECDIVKEFAFIHYRTDEEAIASVKGLHQTEYNGKLIRVERSTSRVRQKPGMGGTEQCFRCGKNGHWSKDCPSRGATERRRGPPGRGPHSDGPRGNQGGGGGGRYDRGNGRDNYDSHGDYNRGPPPRQYDLYENFLPPKGMDGRYLQQNTNYGSNISSYGGERYHPYGNGGGGGGGLGGIRGQQYNQQPMQQQQPQSNYFGFNNMSSPPINQNSMIPNQQNMGYNSMLGGNDGRSGVGNNNNNLMNHIGNMPNRQMVGNSNAYIGPVSSSSNHMSNYTSYNHLENQMAVSSDMSNKLKMNNSALSNLNNLKLDAQSISALSELAVNMSQNSNNNKQQSFVSQPYDYFSNLSRTAGPGTGPNAK